MSVKTFSKRIVAMLPPNDLGADELKLNPTSVAVKSLISVIFKVF